MLEVCPNRVDEIRDRLAPHTVTQIGTITQHPRLVLGELDISMASLFDAWRGGLNL